MSKIIPKIIPKEFTQNELDALRKRALMQSSSIPKYPSVLIANISLEEVLGVFDLAEKYFQNPRHD